MKTTLDVQELIIKHYIHLLSEKDSDGSKYKATRAKKAGRPVHLRVNPAGEEQLNKLWPCEIKSSELKLSGKFKSLEIILKKALPGVAQVGDGCYLVVTQNKKGSGTLTDKDLTPNLLGIAGQKIPKSSFIKTVSNAVDADKSMSASMKLAIKTMLTASAGNGDLGETFSAVDPSDQAIIAKNFGEMSGALWYMTFKDKKADGATYPKAINSKLYDYFINIGDKEQAISAKAGEGAAASVGNLAEILEKIKYNEPKKEAARKAIIAIPTESIIDGCITVARLMKAPGYMYLKKTMFKGKDFTASDVEEALSKYPTYKAMWKGLEGFYNANVGGGRGKEDVAKSIFASKGRRLGFIIAPLGYGVVEVLNKDKDFSSVLNDATSKINALQIYVHLRKNGPDKMKVEYEVHGFKTTGFEFHWQNGPRTLGNRFTMKMDVKKA